MDNKFLTFGWWWVLGIGSLLFVGHIKAMMSLGPSFLFLSLGPLGTVLWFLAIAAVLAPGAVLVLIGKRRAKV
jgi:hypothetical protein